MSFSTAVGPAAFEAAVEGFEGAAARARRAVEARRRVKRRRAMLGVLRSRDVAVERGGGGRGV